MYPTFGTITRCDPRFDRLIRPEAQLEKLASGFAWSEGPIWIRSRQCLLFSDIPNNVINRWQEGDTVASVHRKPSGYTGKKPRGGEPGSNGMTLDREGRLVICEHGDRRVTRIEHDGVKTVLADNWQGKRLNSPNDVVCAPNGDLYFTDPPYGLVGNWDDPERDLPFCGVYRISKSGGLTLLTAGMSRPNGLAFSPDGRLFYVANSDPACAVWMVYDVVADGTIANGRVFFDSTPWVRAGRRGCPDGFKFDRAGNLFATGPGGLLVFTAAGEFLGGIDPGVATANCNWGGDGSVLYITAHQHLCRIRTATYGDRWPLG